LSHLSILSYRYAGRVATVLPWVDG
jgi:hypothetical protein